jgi:hypothetical protein
MATLLVVLDPAKLKTLDTDLMILIPDLVELHSSSDVRSIGWGYAPDKTAHLFFEASTGEEGFRRIKAALESGPVKGNDLCSATIAIRLSKEGPFTAIHPAAVKGQLIADMDA